MSAHEPIPAFSLGLPWAELVLFQKKRLVTEDALPEVGGEPYRGMVLIHATEPDLDAYIRLAGTSAYRRALKAISAPRPEGFGAGTIIGIAEVCWAGILRGWDTTFRYDQQPIAISESPETGTTDRYPISHDQIAFGDFREGCALWAFSWTVPLSKPVPCAPGGSGLWLPPADVLAAVRWESGGLL